MTNTNQQGPAPVSMLPLLETAYIQLCGVEKLILDEVRGNLDILATRGLLPANGGNAAEHDAVFATFTGYADQARRLLMPLRAARLWFEHLEPMVKTFETKHGGKRIHKGVPIYNTGISFFFAGDYMHAAQYIAAAGEEDKDTYGGASRLHLAQGIAQKILIEPLLPWLRAEFGADYLAATGKSLDSNEVIELVRFLSKRDEDAVLFLFTMHRFAFQEVGPENYSVWLHRVRALGDLLLIYESSLRRWQGRGHGDLFDRAQLLLQGRFGTATASRWQALHANYAGLGKEEPGTPDTVFAGEAAKFDNANDKGDKMLAVIYSTYRLRNFLMHVLDSKSRLFSDKALLNKAIGFALIALRLSRAGEDQQLRSM